MKRIVLAALALGFAVTSFAQTDTTAKPAADTITIGGVIIVRKGDKNDTTKNTNVVISNRKSRKNANVTTNWWIVDLGFANFQDETNYGTAAAQAFAPGVGKDQFDLRTGKSVNVNIWMFMQRLNLVQHFVNLKYGLGVELNNYRFDDERVRFQKNPTVITLDPAFAQNIKKNKLAADYVTLPVMLNLNFTPKRDKGFGLSAGVSAGYLYSARQKTKNNDDDKEKLHDNFDLRKWKLSYIGEASLGPVKLYGSYAMKSMWEKALDQTPYNFGIRFSGL
jgi:hypothetical protein